MNVIDLKTFYKSLLSTMVQEQIINIINSVWPDFGQNENIHELAYGYPCPYLINIKESLPIFMPAHMGAIVFPEPLNQTVLIDEELFPLPDHSMERILVIHGLEYALNHQMLLAEIHRILKDDGSVVFIVPNRRSIWAQSDCTPLGSGRPYTMTQLKKQLTQSHFDIKQQKRALYTPPTTNNFLFSLSNMFENFGPRVANKFSGLVAIEAIKSKGTQIIPTCLSDFIFTQNKKHALNM